MVRNLSANAGDTSSIPGEANGNPVQHSCQGKPMNREALWDVSRVQTLLNNRAHMHILPPFLDLLPI